MTIQTGMAKSPPTLSAWTSALQAGKIDVSAKTFLLSPLSLGGLVIAPNSIGVHPFIRGYLESGCGR